MAQRSLVPQEPESPPTQEHSQPDPQPDAEPPQSPPRPHPQSQSRTRSQPRQQPQQPQCPEIDPSAPSPTKSIWRRILNRGASADPAVPVKEASEATISEPPLPATTFASVHEPEESTTQITPLATVDESAKPDGGPGDLSSPPDTRNSGSEAPLSSFNTNDTNTNGNTTNTTDDSYQQKPSIKSRRVQRDVVPGLPRAQTLARQQSELRENLLPVEPSPDERRAASVDRRLSQTTSSVLSSQTFLGPRASAPEIVTRSIDNTVEDTSPVPSQVPFPFTGLSLRPASSVGELSVKNIGLNGTTAGVTTCDQLDRSGTMSGNSAHQEKPEETGDHRNSKDCLNFQNYTDRLRHQDQPDDGPYTGDRASLIDTASITSSQYEQKIRYELEHIWILNLSMHFRDGSRREKFFVTYRQRPDLWRRVTISLDYRRADENSLEMDLLHTKFQRDKNEKIYEAIRDSLVDIQFYNTVTNLKLQTTDGRLHVHVVEDVTEIIEYPSNRMIQHLPCRRIREREIEFDSHMSGFVYKVRVDGRLLIKKEIPGPDSVDEFLYEVNALSFLCHSRNVIEFYGVIVDDDERVKGLLISYAEQGALIDIIYENNQSTPWPTRIRWARQIVQGLSEIHEAGFVQGDFTLSNIVIDDDGDAKIIDINRRGCPVGWEPPEATPIIESNQRIAMYIGVKSDLYQLGMVLWALAMQDDEPEARGRPLHLDHEAMIPPWLRTVIETCLAEDPRMRAQASQLLKLFPFSGGSSPPDSDYDDEDWTGRSHQKAIYTHSAPSASIIDGDRPSQFGQDIDGVDYDGEIDLNYAKGRDQPPEHAHNGIGSRIKTIPSPKQWSYVDFGHTYVDPVNGISNEPYYYPTRGRSPPSRLSSRQNRQSPRRDYNDQHPARTDDGHDQNELQDPAKTEGGSAQPGPCGDQKEIITDINTAAIDKIATPQPAVVGYTTTPTPVLDVSAEPTSAEVMERANAQFDAASSHKREADNGGATPLPDPDPQINPSAVLDEIKGIGAVYDEKNKEGYLSGDARRGEDGTTLDRYSSIDDELNALAMS